MILLNGASSSGKSTLARSLQDALPSPFLHISSDQWVDGGALPRRREPTGPFAWASTMRPRFFDGFHRSIKALVDAGNDLVVDHIIEYAAWRDQLSALLDSVDVFLVDVICDSDELDRRERERGDRFIGEGRSHIEILGIHTLGAADFTIDTTSGVAGSLAAQVVEAWAHRRRHAGLPTTSTCAPLRSRSAT